MVQLDARAGTISTKTVKFDEPNMDSVLRRGSVNQGAEEIRERCNTQNIFLKQEAQYA